MNDFRNFVGTSVCRRVPWGLRIVFCFVSKGKIKCRSVDRDSFRHFNFRLQESDADVLEPRAFIITCHEEL
jgi:hypothetical protein